MISKRIGVVESIKSKSQNLEEITVNINDNI